MPVGLGVLSIFSFQPAHGQPLEKIRIAYSGTGTNAYVMEIGQRNGIFRRNGLDPEIKGIKKAIATSK